jgi:hypothetical protein
MAIPYQSQQQPSASPGMMSAPGVGQPGWTAPSGYVPPAAPLPPKVAKNPWRKNLVPLSSQDMLKRYGPAPGYETIQGQGPINWGNQPGTAPPGGATPPPPGGATPPPAPGGWVKPPQLPSPAPYNPKAAVGAALRQPTGGGSKLVGGYTGP